GHPLTSCSPLDSVPTQMLESFCQTPEIQESIEPSSPEPMECEPPPVKPDRNSPEAERGLRKTSKPPVATACLGPPAQPSPMGRRSFRDDTRRPALYLVEV